MFRRIDKDADPPGGYRYRVDPQGKSFHGWGLGKVVEDVRNYLTSNGLPVPANLPELIDDFTCSDNQGKGCEETDPLRAFMRGAALTWEVVKAGTEALAPWMLAGRPIVEQKIADARGAVCSSCVYNEDVRGCIPCKLGALHNLVNRIVGTAKCANDDQLRACSRCGCSLRAKVWMPIEHLSTLTPIAPLPDWCWVKKEKEADSE